LLQPPDHPNQESGRGSQQATLVPENRVVRGREGLPGDYSPSVQLLTEDLQRDPGDLSPLNHLPKPRWASSVGPVVAVMKREDTESGAGEDVAPQDPKTGADEQVEV